MVVSVGNFDIGEQLKLIEIMSEILIIKGSCNPVKRVDLDYNKKELLSKILKIKMILIDTNSDFIGHIYDLILNKNKIKKLNENLFRSKSDHIYSYNNKVLENIPNKETIDEIIKNIDKSLTNVDFKSFMFEEIRENYKKEIYSEMSKTVLFNINNYKEIESMMHYLLEDKNIHKNIALLNNIKFIVKDNKKLSEKLKKSFPKIKLLDITDVYNNKTSEKIVDLLYDVK